MAGRMMQRIQREIKQLIENPLDGIYIDFDTDNLKYIRALIVGPEGTPYENGYYFIDIHIGDNYPFQNPKCEFMNQFKRNPTIRFNPNLYSCGKICLSILGTWPGEPWTPQMNIRTLLLQIQTRLNEFPIVNEPGFEGRQHEPRNLQYNHLLWYYNLKYSTYYIINNLDSQFSRYKKFEPVLKKLFEENRQKYIESIDKNYKLNDKIISFQTYNMCENLDLKELKHIIQNYKI